MQDLSKKIRFLKYRKRLWRSWPYLFYLRLYERLLFIILNINTSNTKIIFINGMRRSGNHYLMKTLMNSANSNVVFYNNQKVNRELNLRHGIQSKIKFSKKLLLIIGYEDLLTSQYNEACNFILSTFDHKLEYAQLMVIRDLRNLMASRINHAHMAKELRQNKNNIVSLTRQLWLDHHCQNKSSILSLRYSNLHEDLLKLNLEKFFITTIDVSSKILNRYGGGSSFETNNFDKRYTEITDKNTYESLIKDLEIVNDRIYNSNLL